MHVCTERKTEIKVHNYCWILNKHASLSPITPTEPKKTCSITTKGPYKETWLAILYFTVSCTTGSAMQLIFSLMPFVPILWITVPNCAVCKANWLSCRLWTDPQLPGIFMNGDFMIGGIFSIHYYTRSEQNTYTWQPSQLQCSGRSVCGLNRKLWNYYLYIFQKTSTNIM